MLFSVIVFDCGWGRQAIGANVQTTETMQPNGVVRLVEFHMLVTYKYIGRANCVKSSITARFYATLLYIESGALFPCRKQSVTESLRDSASKSEPNVTNIAIN